MSSGYDSDSPAANTRVRSREEILAAQRQLDAELAEADRIEAARQRRKAGKQAVLVPASPSPRKKRVAQDEHFRSGYDSTLAGPPPYDSSLVYRYARPSKPVAEPDFLDQKPQRPSRLEENFAEVQTRTRKTDTREKLNSKRTAVFDLMNPTDRGPLRTAGSTSSSSGSKKSQSGTEDRPPRQSSSRAEARSTKTRSSDALAQVKRESGGMTRHKMNTVKNEDVSDPKSDRARGKQREQEQKPGEDSDEDGLEITDAPTKPNPRHHDGTVIEAIELGPVEHKAPPGDPTFETIEPNSGIALKPGSRLVTHEQIQLHLSDRYHLTPALVYSLARKSIGTDHVDIDVDADFIIIGVLAHKGPIRTTNPSNRDTAKERKNVRFTMVDLSTPEAAASGTGTLSLILFEAQTVDDGYAEDDDHRVPRYVGGSGGAYEKFWKESTGAVVAVLNPQILKHRPQPGMPNTYTITPSSADSMMVIGRAADLGSCQAVKRDGTRCGDWCDIRQRSFCQYHVEAQIKRTKSRRLETANVTTSISKSAQWNSKSFKEGLQTKKGKSTTSAHSSNGDTYDPVNKKGLLPRDNVRVVEGAKVYAPNATLSNGRSSGKTFVTSASDLLRASTYSASGTQGYVAGVRDGPEANLLKEERAKRAKDKKRSEKELKALIKDDKGKSVGGEYVAAAAAVRKKLEEGKAEAKAEKERAKDKGLKRKKLQGRKGPPSASSGSSDDGSDSEQEEGEDDHKSKKKRPFSVAAVRLIGFDPTNHREPDDDAAKKQKSDAISSLLNTRSEVSLAPPPGPKVRSGVKAPTTNGLDLDWDDADHDDELPDLPALPALPILPMRKAASPSAECDTRGERSAFECAEGGVMVQDRDASDEGRTAESHEGSSHSHQAELRNEVRQNERRNEGENDAMDDEEEDDLVIEGAPADARVVPPRPLPRKLA